MKALTASLVLLLFSVGGGSSLRAETLTLAEALQAVREHHPALAAARAQAEAVRTRIDQEKAWMDPRLSLEVKREDTLRPNTYSEVELAVSQELPLSRRNTLRAKGAAAEASMFDAAVLVKLQVVLNQARAAYLRIAAVDTRLQVNTRLRTVLQQSIALAQQGYESGQQMQVDVIETQTELTRLDSDENDLAMQRAEDVARLNGLMQRPTETAIDPLALPEPTPLTLTPAEALERVRGHHPELLMAARRIESAQAQVAVARKNRTPDPEVMLRVKQMNRSGDVISAYDTGVSLSLPWFNDRRNRAQVAEAESGVTAARAEARASEADLAGMVAGMHQRARLAYTQYKRFHDELLPLAQLRAESQRRGYETGTTPLFAALGAERSVLETEASMVKAQADHALATAELDFLTARDLTGP